MCADRFMSEVSCRGGGMRADGTLVLELKLKIDFPFGIKEFIGFIGSPASVEKFR